MSASVSPRRTWLTVSALAVAATVGAVAWYLPPTSAALGGLDLNGAQYAQGFRLQDPDGRWRTLDDYRGKAVMLLFGFTQCPDVCPTALAKAAEVKRSLGTDSVDVQVLFISLDPERDTPEVLRAFAGSFDADIVPLRGDVNLTRQTADAFKVFYRKVPLAGSYSLDHSAMVYLYDRQGRVRRALPPGLDAVSQAAELRTVLSLS